jgi:hypothetical protein
MMKFAFKLRKEFFKEMDIQIEGYKYYICNQKEKIVSILGRDKPILKAEQIIHIEKDELGKLPETLKEKDIVTILKFRIPSHESKNLIIKILDSKNNKIWISPGNIKTH